MGELVKLQTSGTGLAALGSGNSVLGQSQARIPVGGKIRAGIKVLTSTAAKNAKAAELYQRGVQAGDAWDKIEKAIKDACNLDKSPMTPKNVPYFTARRGDFTIPEVADRIMSLYGEDRGDGIRLYRFPIILPLDNWQAVMPHGLRCFTRSELVYWSEYGQDGNRYCHTHGEVEKDPRAQRAKRTFGGRPVVLRNLNDGNCEPDKCPEYQASKCKLSGGLMFYIPGIPGSSAIQLPTTSFYSLSQWRQQMEMVGFLRGRIAGAGENGKPIFYLTKRQEEISMIDPETGKAKRVTQYLVTLEADIDMSKVFQADHAPMLSGPEAAAMLDGPAHIDGEVITGETSPPVDIAPEDDIKAAIKRLRSVVFEALQFLKIDLEQFDAYAKTSWGEYWSRDLEGLEQAKSDLVRAPDDLHAYLARIKQIAGSGIPF